MNLVLITSTIYVDLLELNFNFDDIRTYILQDLRNYRQIAFVTLNGACPLSKKKNPIPVRNGQYQDK